MLYFGSDRYDNSGDAQQGFWFFQNAVSLGTRRASAASRLQRRAHQRRLADHQRLQQRWQDVDDLGVHMGPACRAPEPATARERTSTDANCANCAPPATTVLRHRQPGHDHDAVVVHRQERNAEQRGANGEFYEGGINLSLLGLGGECFASVRSETARRPRRRDAEGLRPRQLRRVPVGAPHDAEDRLPVTTSRRPLSIGTGSVSVKDSATLNVTGANNWSGDAEVRSASAGPTHRYVRHGWHGRSARQRRQHDTSRSHLRRGDGDLGWARIAGEATSRRHAAAFRTATDSSDGRVLHSSPL